MTKSDKKLMNCVILQLFMFISIMYKVIVLLIMGHGSAADTFRNKK